MKSINKVEYKIGDTYKVAAFICAGAEVNRIESSMPNGKKVRVMFVFDKADVEEAEAKYLSGTLKVDARSFVDTIAEVRGIIRNAPNNIEVNDVR